MVTLSPPTSEAGGSVPGTASSGKAGSCLPLVGSLQYRTLDTPTVCTGFLRPSNYPSRYDLYSVESDVKTPK